MKLEWLEAFVAFAERMSFTHAARDLHISQPALHVQIARLTEALGVRLYRREGRALVLTAFATVYVVWGSTYLAIRYAVATLPPFVMAGARFVLASGSRVGDFCSTDPGRRRAVS